MENGKWKMEKEMYTCTEVEKTDWSIATSNIHVIYSRFQVNGLEGDQRVGRNVNNISKKVSGEQDVLRFRFFH